MAFWGVQVKSTKPFVLKADNTRTRLHVSQAALGDGSSKKMVIMHCCVGKRRPILICRLTPGNPFSLMNIEFDEKEDVTFMVSGQRSIHLSGYFYPLSADEESELQPKQTIDKKIEEKEMLNSQTLDQVYVCDNNCKESKCEEMLSSGKGNKKNGVNDQILSGTSSSHTEQRGDAIQASGKHFFEKQSKQVTTLAGGLIIEKIGPTTDNSSDQQADSGDKVHILYTGTLKDSGELFGFNFGKQPYSFILGQGNVIQGWHIGINGMRPGEKRRITVPPALGYGSRGAGRIPGDAWLVYEILLVEVEKHQIHQ